MPGTLFVVATPIGNLEDITLRALRVLREADLVAAEDTRRTAKLFSHHAITTRTVSFHEHNAVSRMPQLIRTLEQGAQVALVTDAGMPGISDPGTRLIERCRAQDLPVTVVPGPSAPLTAAVASGFPVVPLTIHGFAPARSNDRKRWLHALSGASHTVTFFEAPHRMQQLLRDMAVEFGERPICVARELTKRFEEVLAGPAASIAERLGPPRGEFTVVVPATDAPAGPAVRLNDRDIADAFGVVTESGVSSRREAVLVVARKFGVPAKDVYAAIERAKQ